MDIGRTIDGFALRQIVVILACQKGIPVSSNDAFHEAAVVSEATIHKSRCITERTRHSRCRKDLPWQQYDRGE